MARTPEQQAAVDALRASKMQQAAAPAAVPGAAKKPSMRAPGAQAFGMIADAVTPPDVPAGTRAFQSMASTVAPPSAPTLPGTALVAPNRPNFTMPPPAPPGPNMAVAPSTRPNWTIPPAGAAAPQAPGTAVAVSNRPNFTMPGPDVLGTGPAAMRNNAGAVDAAIKTPAAPKPTLGGRAEPFIHGIAPGIAGTLVAGALNDGRQKEAEAASLGARAAAQPFFAKPGEIPKAADGMVPEAGPAPVAGSFLNQSEFGRQAANTLMALPGGGMGIKAAQTALTALPIAARGVRAAQTAVPATLAAAQGFAGGDANFPGKSSAPAATEALPQASYSNEHLRQPAPAFDGTGKIIKTVGADGRVSYSSGGGDIKFGADIHSPDGTLVNGGDPNNPKGMGVSVVGSEGHRQNLLELQRNAASAAAAPEPSTAAGFGGGTLSSGLRESHNRQSTAMSTNTVGQRSQRQQDALDMQRAQLGQAGELGRSQIATTQAGQAQGMRVAEMNNATQREGLNVQREGHAMTHETNMLQRKIAMGQQQYQRQKDAIDLSMRERDYQTGVQKTEFEQKAAREKSLQTKIEQRFTTTGSDGKPTVDSNRVQAFRETMDRAIARKGGKGLQDLSPADEEKLFAATDLLQRVQAGASNINPLKPDLLRTIDAVDLTNLQQDPKTGDYVINSPDNPKAHGQVIPKRFLQTEEAHRFTLGGFRGTPTNRSDILVNGARQ